MYTSRIVACSTIEVHPIFSEAPHLTLLGLQSRFGDNRGQNTRNLSVLSPKPDWSSKGVKELHTSPENWLEQKSN